jgi:hypothetical protein
VSDAKTKVEELIPVNIHHAVTRHWARVIQGNHISFSAENHNNREILVLYVNGIRKDFYWYLSSHVIKGRLRRGGKIPWDKNEVYFVIGRDNKTRYRYLYIDPIAPDNLPIGTKTDFGARYLSRSLSKKKH